MWRIKNFSKRTEEKGGKILSDVFKVSSAQDVTTKWQLSLYPCGSIGAKAGYTSIFVRVTDVVKVRASREFRETLEDQQMMIQDEFEFIDYLIFNNLFQTLISFLKDDRAKRGVQTCLPEQEKERVGEAVEERECPEDVSRSAWSRRSPNGLAIGEGVIQSDSSKKWRNKNSYIFC